ncbi:MAG: dihydrodipicolinate synthase family protein, partial [Vicinamibacterales bacterium]
YSAATLGAHGAVLALAGIAPELCVELVELVKAGRLEEARGLQRRLMPVARSVGPIYGVPGLKAALDLVGLTGGVPRPPLRPVTPAVVDRLRAELTTLGILKEEHAASH